MTRKRYPGWVKFNDCNRFVELAGYVGATVSILRNPPVGLLPMVTGIAVMRFIAQHLFSVGLSANILFRRRGTTFPRASRIPKFTSLPISATAAKISEPRR